MLTASGSTAVKTAAAQHAVATQQFLDAIKDMITEEVSRRLDQKTAAPGASEISDTGNATSANADPAEGQ
jgi:hypothetical protein